MGDIHGNLKAYTQCLRKCRFDLELDTLIQLGDVSDRNPFTAEVVEELLKIQSLIAIRGNHDHWTRNWLVHGVAEAQWMENGGFATIQSYERNKQIDLDLHKAFFDTFQRDYFIDDLNRVYVHGGFRSPLGPQHEMDSVICTWDRSLWSNVVKGQQTDEPPPHLENYHEVFLGHTPTLNWHSAEPMHIFNAWNLDTGAGTSGKLTIMDIDTKEYWQSD